MEQQEHFDKKYANRAMVLFAGFAIIVLYIETMLVPSLPSIAKQFNVDPAEVSLVLSMYLVSGVALNPIIGKLGDIYGKKRMLTYVLPIYVVAVAVTGFSPNFTFMLISRTVQGIGLTIFPLMISLVQEEFPRDMVPRALAIIVAMFGVGSAIGLPLGSLISNYFGWQYTYHTALPIVIIVSALIIVYIRESRYKRPDVKVDYLGAFGIAAFLALLVLAISSGVALGWTSPIIEAMLLSSLIIFVATIIYERRKVDPVLNFKLLGIKNVMSANIITLVAGLLYFISYQTFAYLFESAAPVGFGYSIFLTGLAMAPFAAVNVIVAPIMGRLIPRVGVKPFFLIGAVVGIIGFVISTFAPDAVIAIIGETIVGLAVALVNIPTINLLVLSIEQKEMGLATSLNSVFRFLGSALGAPLAGVFIAASFSKTSFQYPFFIAIIALIVAAIVSLYADEILGRNKKVARVEQEVSI